MKEKRPVVITVICILGFIGAAVTIPMIFSDIAKAIGAWYPPYLAFTTVIGLACMVGLWMMKKWGIIVYAGFFAVNQVVLLTMGVWNVLSLIIPAIVIVIGLLQFSKMD